MNPPFIISAVGIQVRMAAEKAMIFPLFMLVEVFAALLLFSTYFFAVLVGWSVIYLILETIVSSFISSFLFWLFLSQGWRTRFQFNLIEVRSFLGFAS